MRRRRRRNPLSLNNASSLMTLAVVAGVGYLGYKYLMPLLQGLGKTAAAAVNTVSSKIASTVVGNSQIQKGLQGSVVLSNGQEVSVSQLANVKPTTLDDGTASATFTYMGVPYQFTGPSDDTGTYYAYALQ